MKKRICFMAILFAFAMQSVSVWAATQSVTPVYLHYKHTPKLDGMPRPSKAPANYTIPLSVVLDDDNQQLLVTALADGQFTYYIYNDGNGVITQGVLNFSGNGSYTIDLGLCCSGEYELVVVYNDHVFSGTFIDE